MSAATKAPVVIGLQTGPIASMLRSSRGMMGPATAQYRTSNTTKIITGCKPWTLLTPYMDPAYANFGPVSPYDLHDQLWSIYASRTDNWALGGFWVDPGLPFTDPPNTYSDPVSYSGTASLSGAGDCPVLSNYPEIVWSGAVSLVYHTPPDGGRWSDWYWDIPPVFFDGYSYIYYNVTSLSKTVIEYSVSWTDIATETLSETLGSLRDKAAIFATTLGYCMGRAFSSDWATSGGAFVHPSWSMSFNDWAAVDPSSRDTFVLNPADYDDAQIITNANTTPMTPTSALDMCSGWSILGSDWDYTSSKLDLYRCQVQLSTTKPTKYILYRVRGSCGLMDQDWQTTGVRTRQWMSRIEKIGSGFAFPDSAGKVVVEVPFTSGVPFPVSNLFDMPVLTDFVCLEVASLTPIVEGDHFKRKTGGVWVDEVDPIT